MNIELEAKITQLLEVKDEETGEVSFLIEKDGEWSRISKEEYNELLGDNNG